MRATHPVRILSAVAILAAAGACSSESIGPDRPDGGSVTVIPSRATINEGQVVQLTARLVDEFGEPLEGVTLTWSSSNPSVATVSVTGTVFGHAPGRAAITASAMGKAQSAAVHVLEETRLGKPGPKI
jgi:uncharacterized protein YjdB